MKKKVYKNNILPVNNLNLVGENIFEDIYDYGKKIATNVIDKAPGYISDAILKKQIISKAASYVPVIGKPVSDVLGLIGLQEKKTKNKNKRMKILVGQGITTIKRGKRSKK
jgi:hypothetical protein